MKKLITFAVCILLVSASYAQKVTRPRAGAAGGWRLLGHVEAKHSADHDAIVVQGPYDNFRRIKFKVTDAPLNITRMVVVYDNGGAQNINTRLEIPKNGESRVIDLNGGSRSLRRIDFWYDTKGFMNGRADLTLFGMK